MVSIGVSELRKIQLDILSAVHNYCEVNNLRYSLAFGSLLGAVRHKGFIPWDDDIDIVLMRDDYDKLVEGFNGFDKRYRLYEPSLDDDYNFRYAKISDERTLLEEVCSLRNVGINIDVFPIDNLFDSESDSLSFIKSLKSRKLIMRFKILKDSYKMKWYKRIFLQIGKVCLLPISLRKETLNFIEKVKRSGDCDSIYVASLLCNDTKLLKRSLFDDYILVEFENRSFYIVKKYDEWLSLEYGNYMQLPPENKRISPHTLNGAYWK